MPSNGIINFGNLSVGQVPLDTSNAAVAGDWCSLANYNHVDVVIMTGVWGGGTPAVTLDKATSVSGSTTTLAFTKYFLKIGLTGTQWTETAVSSNTFNLTSTANSITVIPIDADDLGDTYDYFQVDIAAASASAALISVLYIYSEPRYATDRGNDVVS